EAEKTMADRGDDGRKQLRLQSFSLESGAVLVDARISFRTYGSLSASGDNAVLLFTYYTGDDLSYQPWIGPGRPIDPHEHFVIIVNHFGGGVSSSPSTTGAGFGEVGLGDSVRAARLVLEELGVARLRLAAGWSLGGMQSLDLAVRYPDYVSTVFALCSAARCSPINQVFLDSVSATLTPECETADAGNRETLERLDAFGRVYAGWAGADHQAMHAGDLMASLRMWRAADGGGTPEALGERLGRIAARTILMPSTTDSYFTVAENLLEVAWLADGEVRPMTTPLGHVGGRPGIRAEEQDQVDACLRELLHS
ncbi:MAG: homoserine O-acetyltransferase, partial [Mycobacterium sp.]|nr:homoserine O-acetyltransferase [Mycobacterium sp.]